jgi:hypothetical protein
MLPAADQASNYCAKDGRKSKQPELRDVGSAGKYRRTRAARRIDRSVRDRNQEEVDKRQAKPNGYPGKSYRRAFRGGADNV